MLRSVAAIDAQERGRHRMLRGVVLPQSARERGLATECSRAWSRHRMLESVALPQNAQEHGPATDAQERGLATECSRAWPCHRCSGAWSPLMLRSSGVQQEPIGSFPSE
eukprot:12658607-Alexandrium_andersonii.AAC.1